MGAMTDVPYNVWTDGMDDAWMGATTDVPYDVWMDVDFTRICAHNLPHVSPHYYQRFSMVFQQTVMR